MKVVELRTLEVDLQVELKVVLMHTLVEVLPTRHVVQLCKRLHPVQVGQLSPSC